MKKDQYRDENDYREALRLAEEISSQISDKKGISDDLKQQLEQNTQIKTLISRLTSKERQQSVVDEFNRKDKQSNILNLMQLAQQRRQSVVLRRRVTMLLSTVAASIVVLLVVVIDRDKPDNQQYVAVEESRQYSKPTLVLEDGEAISLGDNDLDIVNDSYRIVMTDNGKLKYVAAPNDSVVRHNKLIVPSCFTHTVVLSDGSEVTLNAGSRMIYPTSFGGAEREVELQGEAYFKVAESDKPFVVKTANGNVKAYGTEFNVFCGMNDVMETLLVEGSIGVRFPQNNEIRVAPFECVSYDKNTNTVKTEIVNPDDRLGWIVNKFTFKGQSLRRVLYDISTWYGITINEVGDSDHIIITMVQDKSCKLSYMLDFISDIANVEFVDRGKGVYDVK